MDSSLRRIEISFPFSSKGVLTMPAQWMSVAEAAASMKVHPRTIERRLAANKIDSRRNEEGQLQVLVIVPDAVQSVSDGALETVRELADRQVDIAAGSASALVHIAQQQASRAENQLILAREDAGRYRKEAHISLAFVAAMLLFVIVAVGWCAHIITSARGDARLASDRAAQSAELARIAQFDRDAERARFDEAIVARARAEGELTAYKSELVTVVQQASNRPTTQPANLMARLTQAFAGD
jgi:hypothetical protein